MLPCVECILLQNGEAGRHHGRSVAEARVRACTAFVVEMEAKDPATYATHHSHQQCHAADGRHLDPHGATPATQLRVDPSRARVRAHAPHGVPACGCLKNTDD
jgi:hypothetical protein